MSRWTASRAARIGDSAGSGPGWKGFVPASTAEFALALLASLILVAGIVYVDAETGPEVSLSILYLVPIVLSSWFSGLVGGVVISVIGTVAWYLWDPMNGALHFNLLALWNSGARLGMFLTVALTIARLRTTLRRERENADALKRFNDSLDREVKERTEELRRTIRELEVFTYTMAHDLRAPLRAIHGFSDILLESLASAPDPEARQLLRRIAEASRRMDRLVLDLLEYGRLIHMRVEVCPILPNPVLSGVLALMEFQAWKAKSTFDIQEDLPAVMAHPELLRQVFIQLISNALKFGRAEVPARVSVRSERQGEWVRTWVEDNGVGIPPEYYRRIFEPFQRLDSTEAGSGTGMGLALARKAVERMGGLIGVESSPGSGSRFWFDLRAAP